MGEFTMPSLGADMDAGKLLEWYVRPGDSVKRGDIVALVDTDKAAIDVEIFEDGVVGELLVPPGEQVPVGTVLATILPPGTAVETAPAAEAEPARAEQPPTGTPGGAAAEAEPAPSTSIPAPSEEGARAPTPPAPREAPAAPAEPAATAAALGERPMATPAARNHARALGIDLSTVTGTGKHGVITCRDVDAGAQAAEAAVAAETAAAAEMTPAKGTAVPAAVSAWAAAQAATAAPRPHAPPVTTVAQAHVRASPLARRLAAELGVDLTSVAGTGPGGAVTKEDVRAATPSSAAPAAARGAQARQPSTVATAPAEPEEARYGAMRRAIAAAMAKSKREIPHYYLSLHVDVTGALTWLEEVNLERPVTDRILPAAMVLKATALAARDVPDVNGFYLEDGFHPSEAVHLGVGISLRQGGLIAPAIHDVDRKDLDQLMADLRDLVKRTRTLQLRSSELSDATMTTTNLGDQGVESVFGIIYPPQVALVGYGRVLERPWAENGMLAVRKQMHLTLAADHRASDGHRGGLFLSAIERHLQHPEEL